MRLVIPQAGRFHTSSGFSDCICGKILGEQTVNYGPTKPNFLADAGLGMKRVVVPVSFSLTIAQL